MKTTLDCIPCFFRQALEAARLAGADATLQRRILCDVAEALPGFSLDASPPEMARIIHGRVRERTGNADPYRSIKERSNRMALDAARRLSSLLDGEADRLRTAVRLSIAGNIIDYGAKNSLNVDAALKRMLDGGKDALPAPAPDFFHFPDFETGLREAGTILFLADNAGEIAFDRLLLEEITRRHPEKEIVVAVKEKPAINDALFRDALDCGLQAAARIVSSGSDTPGTPLSRCSREFLELYRRADMIISKGQGNFETLSDAERPVFFLLLTKCPVIARDIGCAVGDAVLIHHRGKAAGQAGRRSGVSDGS
ncbi:DUF89 family protein [bacterium]|nr:DUF89 family protein [bacterium]